jgi:hypothetical protein
VQDQQPGRGQQRHRQHLEREAEFEPDVFQIDVEAAWSRRTPRRG